MIDLEDMDDVIAVLQMYLFRKVFVRWGMDWDMDKWIRVNPGTESENERFVSALKWLRGKKRKLRGITALEYLHCTEGKQLTRAALRAGFPPHMLRRVLIPSIRFPVPAVCTEDR
jgi:hypothetical protein